MRCVVTINVNKNVNADAKKTNTLRCTVKRKTSSVARREATKTRSTKGGNRDNPAKEVVSNMSVIPALTNKTPLALDEAQATTREVVRVKTSNESNNVEPKKLVADVSVKSKRLDPVGSNPQVLGNQVSLSKTKTLLIGLELIIHGGINSNKEQLLEVRDATLVHKVSRLPLNLKELRAVNL